ncbi:MAG: hypothetical protein A2087_12110 [Spirochaetes bacterium GWD1_61_31]|nr:MAG: hypothetical protein A2Y37_05925 [Spirochaetes bacterium GWB1_60_80]OHD33312.1 MAG: hypothetical protein A2004_07685 [Spirochaetes bacterium GWC1_61_12]OHD34544.1 MAG: hypothetical protein A2087_12110 [Spirochaetes bacterium GWD1_61_31]OHD41567.1 MAG: hypothetical protein A2Y35_02375 [Spirochaetes bacterium GWE1_60_18]OHD61472.1 MAG: hypothetical protein A2Y32_02645 [Spirochaetes bacterium GWF1_60_12]
MGFTPWPYAPTQQAVNDVYSFINAEGDLVAHHFQQGIPYTADTADFSSYHQSIQAEIDGRLAATASGKLMYLAIDSLNGARDDLADLWTDSGTAPRPAPWDSKGFDDPAVIAAYIEFSLTVLEKFRTAYGTLPAYFNYGTEISDLMINDPAKFSAYTVFAREVYTNIKAACPSLKMMVSIALKTPGSAEMASAQAGFTRIRDYVDVVGISTYGYAFYGHADKGNPDNLPADWLTQILMIAPGKPYGVTETGWIAENLSIPAYGLAVAGSESWQNKYLARLFDECNNQLQAELLIWFTAYDYDRLWSETLAGADLPKIWKDTGLVDEDFRERCALATWRNWLRRRH